ncbi:MAG: hypothetical protein H7Y32_18880 [Chloroflexales bacterium]|nr:hypothetical protein [Chloroflexales bacterium]
MTITISGRTTRRANREPLAFAPVRLVALADALGTTPGARPFDAASWGWTRQICGFAGTRWNLWEQQLKGRVAGLAWDQFCDPALAVNPGLQPDRLFKADQTYLVPEQAGPPAYSWTRRLSGFAGTRWNLWEQQLKGRVAGLAWDQFCDPALVVNPHLQPDRLFKADQTYLVPENSGQQYAYLDTFSAADGNYSFALAAPPGICTLLAGAPGVSLSAVALITGDSALDLELNPATPTNILAPAPVPADSSPLPLPIMARGSVRSTRPDYAALPELARLVIDQALAMLGNDADTFDALPPALQRMCYGNDFLHNPADPHYKDICCGDLVGVALAAAGLDVRWGAYRGNTRKADYYHPHNGDGKLIEIRDPHDYLPGDIFVFGNGDPEGTARHVALYVGPFEGTDRSGNAYPAAKRCEVVEGSLDTGTGAARKWTAVRGIALAAALNGEYGTFSWVRRVRLRQLASAFNR